MLEAFGGTLSFAVGIAISPLPVVATVLMLLAPRARGASLGLAAGWLLGVVLVTSLGILVGGSDSTGDSSESPWKAVVQIVLGALLVLAAVDSYRQRSSAKTPAWVSAVDKMSAGRAFVLGVALAGINPKNFGLALAAGVQIGSQELSRGGTVTITAIFCVLAAGSVLVPVLSYLVWPAAMAGPLTSLKNWMLENNSTVTIVLLLVLGMALLGQGLAAL